MEFTTMYFSTAPSIPGLAKGVFRQTNSCFQREVQAQRRKLNISNPTTGMQKLVEIDDDKKLPLSCCLAKAVNKKERMDDTWQQQSCHSLCVSIYMHTFVVCIYTCTFGFVHLCACINIHNRYIHICRKIIHVFTNTHTHAYAYVFVYVFVYVYVYVCVYVYVYVYMYMYM